MRRRCRCFWKRIEIKLIGLIFLMIGITVLLIICLPAIAWVIILALIMICIGYSLFCRY